MVLDVVARAQVQPYLLQQFMQAKSTLCAASRDILAFYPENSHSAPRTAVHSLYDFLGRYLGDARPESIAGTFARLSSTLVK